MYIVQYIFLRKERNLVPYYLKTLVVSASSRSIDLNLKLNNSQFCDEKLLLIFLFFCFYLIRKNGYLGVVLSIFVRSSSSSARCSPLLNIDLFQGPPQSPVCGFVRSLYTNIRTRDFCFNAIPLEANIFTLTSSINHCSSIS